MADNSLFGQENKRKFRFILVGGWNTLAGYLIFVCFDYLFMKLIDTRYIAYMTAMILAQAVSICQAFVMHRYITFRSKTKGRAILVEFGRFVMTYLGVCIAAPIMLPVFVEVFKITPRISAAIITLITATISYFGHANFSFRQRI